MKHMFLFTINLIISIDALTYQDLKTKNGSFHQLASCHVPDPTCYCDDACNEHNDCCLDAKAYDPFRVDESNYNYMCRKASLHTTHIQNYVYMKQECKQGWSGKLELRNCKQSNVMKTDIITIGNEAKFDLPVTSISSNLTFKNHYCAVCNNESLENIKEWSVEVQCNFFDIPGVDKAYIRTYMKHADNMWYMKNINSTSESWRVCRMKAVIPEALDSRVRRCIDNIATCKPYLVKDKYDYKLCQSYTAYVSSHLTTYKNYHCALCNERYVDEFLQYRTISKTSVKDENSDLEENDCQFEYKSCLYSGNCFNDVQCHEDNRCKCDNQCLEYRDCCTEAKSYNQSKWLNTEDRFECVAVHLGELDDIYIRQKCLDDRSKSKMNDHCLEMSEDIHDVPVTSTTTNITYTNLNCGLCNKELLGDLQTWQIRVSCEWKTADNTTENPVPSESYVKENLRLVDGEWGLVNQKNGKSEFLPCEFKNLPGNDLLPRIRSCTKYVSTCSKNWTDPHAESLCNSYTRIVSARSENYRNYHCAICNFVENHEIMCRAKMPAVGTRFGVSQSFNVLMDVSNTANAKNRKNSNLAIKFG